MAGVIRITLEGKDVNEDVQNTFYFWSADAVPTDMEDLADLLAADFSSAIGTSLHTDYSCDSVLVSFNGLTALEKFSPTMRHPITAIAGGGGGDALPEGTCILLNFRNSNQTLNRKRVYVGPWAESHNTNKKPISAIVGQCEAFIADVLAGYTANAHVYVPCVVRLDPLGRYIDQKLLVYGFVSEKWSKLRSRQST